MPSGLGWLLFAIAAYGAIGLAVAVWFVGWRAPATDPAARQAPLRVRVLFVPGAIAVWPAVVLMQKPPRLASERDGDS